MSRLTRDGTAEPVSRDQILRRERGQGTNHFRCSADHEQDELPTLLVVRWTAKMNISLSSSAPESVVSRDGFGRPVPCQPAHSPHSGWIWCLLTGFLPISAATYIYSFEPSCAIGWVPSLSGHAFAYRWRSLPRARRHRARKLFRVVPSGCCLCRSPWTNWCASLFPHPLGGLELVKLARDPASNRPKPSGSLENASKMLPVHRFLLAIVRRKQAVVRGQLSPQKAPASRLWFRYRYRPQGFGTPLARRRSSCPASLPNLVRTDAIERGAVRLRVLRRPTRQAFRDSAVPASRVPPPPEWRQIGARKEVHRVDIIVDQPNRRRVPTDRLKNLGDSQLAASGESDPTPAGKILPLSCAKTRVGLSEGDGTLLGVDYDYNYYNYVSIPRQPAWPRMKCCRINIETIDTAPTRSWLISHYSTTIHCSTNYSVFTFSPPNT